MRKKLLILMSLKKSDMKIFKKYSGLEKKHAIPPPNS